MRVLPLVLGLASVLSPGLASAAIIYDSVDVDPSAFNAGWDPISPVANGPSAASFLVSSATTLSSVSLELSAANPSDGGTLTVVLMADNGSKPPFSFTPYGTLPTTGITTFTNDTVLATILDSALSATAIPSLVTIQTSATLSPGAYWIGLETAQLPSSVLAGDAPDAGTYGSSEWWWTGDNPANAVGVTGQLDFTAGGGPSSFPISGGAANALSPYELVLTTTDVIPEPTTTAILGGGLLALDYVRRRKARGR